MYNPNRAPALLILLVTAATASLLLSASDIPSDCETICAPIVKLTGICDIPDSMGNMPMGSMTMMSNMPMATGGTSMDAQMMAETKLEVTCICENKSFDVKKIMGLCESCIQMSNGLQNDIKALATACAVKPVAYAPSSTAEVANVVVQATKPTSTGTNSAAGISSAGMHSADGNSEFVVFSVIIAGIILGTLAL